MQKRTKILTCIIGGIGFLSLRSAPLRAEQKKESPEPPFEVYVSAPSFRGIDRVEMAIRGKKETWRCVVYDGNESNAKSRPCLRNFGWRTEASGEYGFLVYSWRSGDKKPTVIGQQLEIGGDELSIRAKLRFRAVEPCDAVPIEGKEDKTIPIALAIFTIERVRRAPQNLILRSAWAPQPSGTVKYELINNSNQIWHGTGNMANFFGRVEIFKNGIWKPYERGDKCGVDSYKGGLRPGVATDSIEGYFAGNVQPFLPGQYRYIVEVASEAYENRFSCPLIEAGAPTLLKWDLYEQHATFSIK